MVSRLDFRFEEMIRNQEIEMDNERIHQQVQESPND
jgi:hypothetical protein